MVCDPSKQGSKICATMRLGLGCAGALDRWMGNEQERRGLLEAVAHDCQRSAQLDWASELFLYAKAPRPALNLLNLQISDLLEPGYQSDGDHINIPSSRKKLRPFLDWNQCSYGLLPEPFCPSDFIFLGRLTSNLLHCNAK